MPVRKQRNLDPSEEPSILEALAKLSASDPAGYEALRAAVAGAVQRQTDGEDRTAAKVNLDPIESPTMTVEQLADLMGAGRTATYDAVRRGELPSIKVGRKLVIPTAAVRRLLQLDEVKAS